MRVVKNRGYVFCTFLMLTGNLGAWNGYSQTNESTPIPLEAATTPQSTPSTPTPQTLQASDTNSLYYSTFEMRHHLSAIYGENGLPKSQLPSLHFRGQVGRMLFQNKLDVYATFGAVKLPNTQQVLQRRSELSADAFFVKTPNWQFQGYAVALLPFHNETPYSLKNEMEHEKYADYSQFLENKGTMYIVGATPSWTINLLREASYDFGIRSVLDAWTYLYSEKQYQTLSDDTASSQRTAEPKEDTKLRFGLKPSFGWQWAFKSLNLAVSTEFFSSHFFYPTYSHKDNEEVTHKYQVERSSSYRLRTIWRWTEQITLVNDFFHYHDGFFAAKVGIEEPRYRNVVRIICDL